MRKLLVPFLLLLLLPATAFARQPLPPGGNGTLSIREGRGIVQLSARGTFTGRLRGKLTITDPNPNDPRRPIVYGATRTTYKSQKTVVYQGRNLRFRLVGSQYAIRLDGRAIFLSAIGRGTGMLDGAGDLQRQVFYDGVFSLNDEPYRSLPDEATEFDLVTPTPG